MSKIVQVVAAQTGIGRVVQQPATHRERLPKLARYDDSAREEYNCLEELLHTSCSRRGNVRNFLQWAASLQAQGS